MRDESKEYNDYVSKEYNTHKINKMSNLPTEKKEKLNQALAYFKTNSEDLLDIMWHNVEGCDADYLRAYDEMTSYVFGELSDTDLSPYTQEFAVLITEDHQSNKVDDN